MKDSHILYFEKIILFLVVLFLSGIVLYSLNPTHYWFMPKCPIKVLTGLSCPGCGIQRAIHALLHGHLYESIQYNYYLIYSLPYASAFVFLWLMPERDSRKKFKKVIENKYVVTFFIASFSIWFVVRNVLNI